MDESAWFGGMKGGVVYFEGGLYVCLILGIQERNECSNFLFDFIKKKMIVDRILSVHQDDGSLDEK